jgi:hypothetical protein
MGDLTRNLAAWRALIIDPGMSRATIAFALALTIIAPVVWLGLILVVEAVIQ